MGKRFSCNGLMFKMLVVTLTVLVWGVVEGVSLSKQKSLEIEKKMNSLRKQATSIQVPISVSSSSPHLLIEAYFLFHEQCINT